MVASQKNVLSYLEQSAAKTPEKCAVIDETGSYSYGELSRSAQVAGSRLVRENAAGRAVIVFFDKGFNALSVMMGALYAGAFYVPVDPTVPAQRLSSIASTLGDPLVVASAATRETAASAAPQAQILSVEELLQDGGEEVTSLLIPTDISASPAYVLFTSGSTGTPKGVAVSHEAIIDFIGSFTETFGFAADDRFANQAPFDFDVSVKDIYSALSLGATLVAIPRALFVQPAALVEFLDDNQVTVLTWAVAALCLVSGFKALDVRPLASVRQVLFSGEVMPHRHLKKWMKALPEARFVNLYGPTEITCNCLYHIIDRERDYSDGIPLGTAFAHREVLLVDEENQLVTQPGGVGEVVVRGNSLALGYVSNPEQTAKVFVQNPTHNRFPDRVYRTGDLAVISENGEIFYSGRRDNQIKHQGHRIELEEIDAVVERVDGVIRCRSAYDHKRQRLYAFYEGAPDPDSVAANMREMVPAAMVPSKFCQVEAMPLTKNGKVDRSLLLAQELERK